MITELEFKSLSAQGFNRIPLIAEAFADLETPLSLYLKLAYASGGGKHSFLLESVVGGERFGRYSFIGLPARTLLRATGFRTEVVTDGEVVEVAEGNPLDFIAAYQKRFKVALRPGLPRFAAIALMTGYAWLLVGAFAGGGLAIHAVTHSTHGPRRDLTSVNDGAAVCTQSHRRRGRVSRRLPPWSQGAQARARHNSVGKVDLP